MRIPLSDPAKKFFFRGSLLLATSTYIAFATIQFAAAYFAGKPDLADRQRAARLQSGNAEYRNRIGRYFSLVQDWPSAEKNYRAAVVLNPHRASYWLDLATSYQFLGNRTAQRAALEHAISSDAWTPDVAWQAANLYLSVGDTDRAMQEFRVVLGNDPYLPPSALQLCWRAKPDVNLLLKDVVPPISSVYSAFLELLISREEIGPAASVWAGSVELRQPIENRYIFDYVRFLISKQKVADALKVWGQSATLSSLSTYQPSSENLVVNGDFSLPLLNAGFDWLYEKSTRVSLALDSTQAYFGPRSLRISFEGGPIQDAGIRQLVPVEPNTNYEFSAYFRSQNLEGAGGPQFVLDDFYSGESYFTSEPLIGGDTWKQVSGSFLTHGQTQLLQMHVKKTPPGTAIRGKLWIDAIRLAPASHRENPL
jgi:tetratricopeptide (TPR) repeat protein